MADTDPGELKFIIDEPASVDFFNTHSPVASAMTRAILTNRELKIVGLLGRWGSGKSTIVREVEAKLKEANSAFLTFNYDAWLHQNDPVRRSFLESLVGFLVRGGHIDGGLWEKTLKKLSGGLETTDAYETPIVTSEAKLFFVLALLIPLGVSMLGRETFAAAFGSSTTQAGWWTFVLGLALIAGPIAFWIIRTITLKLRGREAAFFPTLLLNKNISHKNIKIQKSPEPSSIEFGREFRNLMQEIHRKNIRLAIVIDNIDRVDDEEAMQIWASMRSFFLSHADDDSLESEAYHPTVVLPVDAQSISHMFAIGSNREDGERLAQSFINKTFDVTFDVPAPVMSDWKRYLLEQMRFCLGVEFSEERFFRTRQHLEAWFDFTKTPVTPREINKALNRIVALLLQWRGSEIAFEVVAYFSINRDRITDDILQEITRDVTPLSRTVSDWARQIAALHFGVGVDLAAQVLMTEPIKRAFLDSASKDDALEAYRKVSGYGDTFEQVTANLPGDESRPAPNLEIIANAARLLAREVDTGPWYGSSWKNLIAAFETAQGDLTQPCDQIAAMIDKVDGEDAEGFVRAVEAIVDREISRPAMTPDMARQIGRLGELTLDLAERTDARTPIFDLTGDAATYLQRLSQLNDHPAVQRCMRCAVSNADIVAELATQVTDENKSAAVPMLAALLTSEWAEAMIGEALANVEDLFAAAEAAARNNPGEANLFRNAVQTLMAPSGFAERQRAALESLAQDGTFGGKLASVAGTDDADTSAIMLAALVWKQVEITSPTGSFWSEFLRHFPGISEQINRDLDRILEGELQIDIMRAHYDTHSRSRDLITALMDDRVRRGDLGRLVSSKVLSDLYQYSRMVSGSLTSQFASRLASYEKFWPNVKTMPWSASMFNMAESLRRQGGDSAARITSELTERVHNAQEAEWSAAIEQGAEPYRITIRFLDASVVKLGVNSSLTHALVLSAEKAATGARFMRARWFELAEVLTGAGRRKAMKAMASALLGASPRNKLRTLKAGGARLLNEGGLDKLPNDTIERLVIPLARSEKGRSWLHDRHSDVRALMQGADTKSWDRLAHLVRGYANSTNEDCRHWAELATKWWKIRP